MNADISISGPANLDCVDISVAVETNRNKSGAIANNSGVILPVGQHPNLGQSLNSRAIHTFQPYLRISHLANDCTDGAPASEPITKEIMRLLSMSESEAKKDFNDRFQYQQVDYGYDKKTAEASYGIFAKNNIKENEIIGIYSGVQYVILYDGQEVVSSELGLENLKIVLPDHLNYIRTMLAGLPGKGKLQRTPFKYLINVPSKEGVYGKIVLVPDNERYTPMHFVNSANSHDKVNSYINCVRISTKRREYCVLVQIALRDIKRGEEILGSYLLDIKEADKHLCSLTAIKEEELFTKELESLHEQVSKISKLSGIPIPMYVHAPVYYISDELQGRKVVSLA